MKNPNMNLILLSEDIRVKPLLKLNEIVNQALLKDKIEEIDIHSRARPTILLYLLNSKMMNLFVNIFEEEAIANLF